MMWLTVSVPGQQQNDLRDQKALHSPRSIASAAMLFKRVTELINMQLEIVPWVALFSKSSHNAVDR